MNKNNLLFPITLGLSDGIITTLMLTSRILLTGGSIATDLIFRIAFGASFVGGFSFFIAEYSRLREEIARTSKMLIMRSPDKLVKGKIGRDILAEAVLATSLSVLTGFIGALIPLTFSALFSGSRIIPELVAWIALALLGAGLARSVQGKYVFWIITMILVGVIITFLGFFLNLVG
ncbi:MAG: hypothetical protein LVQ96_06110 [Thermoplasmatales archaeon]|nr:hypothetical protein [Thermoplasmatales archaeon]MCW6170729.1 hypothetical protein [Thermoplasmatales archaeon]